MPRKKPTAPAPVVDADQDAPDIPQDFDAGAALQKDRAGPIREKYPVTEGAANFASMKQRAEEAVSSCTMETA